MDVWQKYTSEHVNGVRLSTSIFDHFEKDAHRIFATNPSKVSLEIWRLTLPKARFQKSCLNSDASLNLFFQDQEEADQTIFFLSQETSWSRLRISFIMFCSLCYQLKLPPVFINHLTMFGYKRTDTDGYYNLVSLNIQKGNKTQLQKSAYNICYNIRYVERHGRQNVNPWSFRNLAVCHTLESDTHRSKWVFVSLPRPVMAHIEHSSSAPEEQAPNSLLYHMAIFDYCMYNWRWYINYMDTETQKISDAVTFSKLKACGDLDFSINFKTSQRLGWLRAQLEHALHILSSYASIMNGFRAYSQDLQENHALPLADFESIKYFVQEQEEAIQCHTSKVRMLLVTYDFMAQTVFQMLSLRNSNLIYENSDALKQHAQDAAWKTKTILRLGMETCSDLHSMRVVTFVTIAYTPAAIVAAVFSSDLIEVSATSFQIRKEIWIFVLITAALSLATLLGTWYLEQTMRRTFLRFQMSDSVSKTKP